MMPYQVYLTKKALKELERLLEQNDAQGIPARIVQLDCDPRADTAKLEGNEYRIHAGRNYRVFFQVDDDVCEVTVTKIERRTTTTYKRR